MDKLAELVKARDQTLARELPEIRFERGAHVYGSSTATPRPPTRAANPRGARSTVMVLGSAESRMVDPCAHRRGACSR